MRLRAACLALTGLLVATAAAAAPKYSAQKPPPIRHVFVIVLENQSYRVSFGPDSKAPYLARELPKRGVLVKEYYGTAHPSLPDYIAMVAGLEPNADTSTNCKVFTPACVYPPEQKTIGHQLEARHYTWKNYAEDSALGNPATCRHPEIGGPDTARGGKPDDQYATRHVPWVYFHSIIDSPDCAKKVVDLADLNKDLARTKTTPNLAFIVPDVCSDGHDEVCADGKSPGGFGGIDAFLKVWVPRILASPAYKKDGLLIVIFDEADPRDPVEGDLACCGQEANRGGGRTGAVLLSKYIEPGTVSEVPYNHYSLLRSLETIFGLPYLGHAGDEGLRGFGEDIYSGSSRTK